MLNKFFSKPLELQVGEQSLKFSSVGDFDFAVSGRIAVPSKKITDMVKFSPEQLQKEARTIKEIEKKFVAILSKSIEDSNSINRAIRELDPLIFSQDHGWRDIVNSLNSGDEEFNPFRRVALVKYMQYLSARQEIIKYLYSEKKKMLNEPIVKSGEENEQGEFRETLMLENTIFEPVADDKKGRSDFDRMPKGEAVTVTLKPGAEMVILLSKHKCSVIAKDGIQFVDHTGKSYTLGKGRNIIGRDTVSTVILDPSLRDISRLHLVIDNIDDSSLQLTDLSSHGSFMPIKYLEHHSSW
jgi:FHA domain-containing protein